PNKFIETPSYTIERLRHDDPRLEDTKASYAMADQPASESPYQVKKEDQAPVKPRQEAVVKGITPATPAPQREPAAEAAPSFWSKLFAIFKSEPEPPVRQKPVPSGRTSRGEAGSAQGRSGRGQDRRRERDRGDGRADGRGEAKGRDAGRDAKEPREPREPREGRNGRGGGREGAVREAKETTAREPREPREAREPREGGRGDTREGRGRDRGERREPREARPVAETSGPDSAGVKGTADAAPPNDLESRLDASPAMANQEDSVPSDTVGTANGAPSEKPRRRRRRGGRSEAASDTGADLDAAAKMPDSDDESAVSEAPRAIAPQGIEIPPVLEPTPIAIPVTAPVAAPVVAPAAVPAMIHQAAEPLVAPAPAPAVPASAPTASAAHIEDDLAKAGLQWVQTDPGKTAAPTDQSAAPPPPAGRRLKRPDPVSTDEPLMMVETKPD
ncbi:MAG: hypothetical protein RLZZ344_806, partial [Pseudomonadota bacterium]